MLIVSALLAALLPVSYTQAQVDYNRDGFITFEDFDAFVDDFVDGEPRSDLNSDLAIDFIDFDTFVQARGQVNFWFYWMVPSRESGRNDMDTETDVGDAPVRRDCFIFFAQQFSKSLWLVDGKGTTTTSDDTVVDEGAHVMFRDPGLSPTPTYNNWRTNHTNWMTAHAANVRTVVPSLVENPNFSGLITFDFERVYPSWDGLNRLSQRPVDDLLTPTALEIQVGKWKSMIAAINANSWNTEFTGLIGYTPPSGKIKWSDLSFSEQNTLSKKAYNVFTIDYFVQTVNNARAVRPNAKYGYYNLPMAWYGQLFPGQQADNNDLSSLWATVDVLNPSMYVKYYSTPNLLIDPPLCIQAFNLPQENDDWYRSVIFEESNRIRTTWGIPYGKPQQKIMPFVWWRYHDQAVKCLNPAPCVFPLVFLRNTNLSQAIRQPWLYGADALIIWGFLGYDPCNQKYAEDPLVLGPEIRNNWSPIMKEILPVPNASSRGIDYGPWNDSPPWRGNEGFDQLPDQTPAAAGAKTSR